MAFWRKIPAPSDVLRAPSPSSLRTSPSHSDNLTPPTPFQAESRATPIDGRPPSLPEAAQEVVRTGRRDRGEEAETGVTEEPRLVHVVEQVMNREEKMSRLGTLLGRKKSKSQLGEGGNLSPEARHPATQSSQSHQAPGLASSEVHESLHRPLVASVSRSNTTRTSSSAAPSPPVPSAPSLSRRSTIVYLPTNPDPEEEELPEDSRESQPRAAPSSSPEDVQPPLAPPITPYQRSTVPLQPEQLAFNTLSTSDPMARSSDRRRGPVGLRNLGNTCYMASVLQCIAVSGAVTSYLTTDEYRGQLNLENERGTGGTLSKATARLLRAMDRSDRAVDPSRFHDVFVHYNPEFDTSGQHDAQEFLGFLLDGLHEDVNLSGDLSNVSPLSSEAGEQVERLPEVIGAELAWHRHCETDDSLIVDLFGGMFRNKLRCLRCQQTSTTFNPFQILSLPIPPPTRHQPDVELADCFNTFLEAEVMEDEDAWKCPHCRRPRPTKKWLSISRLPDGILIIHLKRFASFEGDSEKIETPVAFPLRHLDLSSLLPRPLQGQKGTSAVYQLYGIINYYSEEQEEMETGHYTAMLKRGSVWYEIDDEEVEEIDEQTVAEAARSAYLLFYSRDH